MPGFRMNRISEDYMNRCLAQDVPSSAEVIALLGGIDSMIYVMEYMEHGNFNVTSP